MDNITYGEILAEIANSISSSRSVTIVESTGNKEDDDRAMAIAILALKLRIAPVLLLRSIVENWDAQRITRELY